MISNGKTIRRKTINWMCYTPADAEIWTIWNPQPSNSKPLDFTAFELSFPCSFNHEVPEAIWGENEVAGVLWRLVCEIASITKRDFTVNVSETRKECTVGSASGIGNCIVNVGLGDGSVGERRNSTLGWFNSPPLNSLRSESKHYGRKRLIKHHFHCLV